MSLRYAFYASILGSTSQYSNLQEHTVWVHTVEEHSLSLSTNQLQGTAAPPLRADPPSQASPGCS